MKKFWIAFAVGALVGGAAALLYAPQSGASTRKKIKRELEDWGDSLGEAADYLKEQAERLSKEAQRLIDSSKGQFGDALEAAQSYVKDATGTAQEYVKTASGKATDAASRLM